MFARALLSAFAIAALTACPPNDAQKKEPSGPVKTCTRSGQQCELSPGKLGTCVDKESCDGNDCFVCQSQH